MTDPRTSTIASSRAWGSAAAIAVVAATMGLVAPSCQELDASRSVYRTQYGAGDYGDFYDDPEDDPCEECAKCGQGCDAEGNCTGEPCGGHPCVSCTNNGCENDCDNCEYCLVIPNITASCAPICEVDCVDGVCTCENDDDCNPPDGSTCLTCENGECVSACDADNCETCPYEVEGPSACEQKCPGECDGHGECQWGCDETCDSSQCQACVDGSCENACDDGMTCIAGECHEPGCEGNPPPCSVCQDGQWVGFCDPNSCSVCLDGTCQNACEAWATCVDGECVVEADCDPPCNERCESCVIEDDEPTCVYGCSPSQECFWDGPMEGSPGPGGETTPSGCFTPCDDCGECAECSNGVCVPCPLCVRRDDGSKYCSL